LRVPVLGSALAAVLVTDILMKKLVFAAVLLLAGVAMWSFSVPPGAGSETTTPLGTDPVSLAARATSGSEGATEEFGSVVPAERSSLAAPAVAAAPLRIQVVDAEGEPVAGVRVRAHID